MTKIAAVGPLAASVIALSASQAAAHEVAAEAIGSRVTIPKALPDRASIEEDSPFYTDFGGLKAGVRFNGEVRKDDVAEYCVSEGWIRVVTRVNGTLKRERGRLVCIKLKGKVEPFYQ